MRGFIRVVVASTLGLLAWPAGTIGAQETPEPATTPAATQSYSQQGADSCIRCHDEPEVLALFKTPHGRRSDARTPFGHGQLQCESCHGPGGRHAARIRSGQERPPIPHFGFKSESAAAERNEMCLGCHQAGMRHGWKGSSHEREGLSCANCHRMHAARDAVFTEAGQSEVCFGCHKQQRAQANLPYSHPLRQGQMACSSCHDPHGTMADYSLVKRTLNDTCYACHAEKRGPFLWEHAPVAEACTICHQPHGSSHTALLSRRAPMLCQQCHSQQGHPSIPVSAARLPGGNPSVLMLGQGCLNCHSQVHGSNHPSGAKLMR